MRHSLLMVLCCLLPLTAIFLLPLFGITEGAVLAIFLILCFGSHLFLMRGCHHRQMKQQEESHEQT